MQIQSGYLIVKQFPELYRNYENPMPQGIFLYAIPNLNKNPENITKQYCGISRETLLSWLPIFDTTENNLISPYMEKEAGFALNLLEEFGRAEDSYMLSLEDAQQIYSLIAEKEKWEVIWVTIQNEQNETSPVGSNLLGYEPTLLMGNRFSPISDTMFFPRWYGTDKTGKAFKSHFELLNEYGLFNTSENAQSFLDHYLSFDWTGRGEYVIVEVRAIPIKERNNISSEFVRSVIQSLWSQIMGTEKVKKKKQELYSQPSRIGKIEYNDEWKLTTARKVALERLTELGVDITSSMSKKNFTLWIPGLPEVLDPSIYIEIGYLMAQLSDESFPGNYVPLSEVSSKHFHRYQSIYPPVEYAEVYPGSMKYRVNLRKH